jgi:hypothetical protein
MMRGNVIKLGWSPEFIPAARLKKEAYPAAQVHTFQGWGHLGILATGPVIQAFLQSSNKQVGAEMLDS